MWEAIAAILTNANALLVLVFVVIFFLLFVLLARTGLVQISTNSFRMGADTRERDIIRQQIEWTHAYLRGIEGQIEVDTSIYHGFKTKYLIEIFYIEIITWILYNHINVESDYINIKQTKIRSMLGSMDVPPEFRTEKFGKRLDGWVEEIIQRLIQIRKVYK